ncbi:Phage tail assembly [Streptococcus sp. DD10]|uniref:phage tail spike protein n=1 Tax=Streptococcus sp. DD10 TaxID=1777878 RepID=UPI000792CD02|nr:phage tail spike protein [Streptococcus sp. DD10]KXT73202.1 Phage tail assembly [Streptococcus sp. DD10]
MIYLAEGNFPLNGCYDDDIVQEDASTYQLTFKFPTSDEKWKLLKEEMLLLADDLDGEQLFTIFEVVKQHGYVTVYANQVMTLLHHYSISSVNVDKVVGNVVMSSLAGAILRNSPFSFFSDISDRHTLNVADRSAMDVLVKDKHSILGQWGGDLVRDKYQVRLLKNGGSENESLFMYKKNMRSYQQTTSTKELRTRIHFRKKIEEGEGDNRRERWLRVTVDSPLISQYVNVYESDMEVTDEDVKDLASLTQYGKDYYKNTLCDLIEDSLELDVVGTGDVAVKLYDVVSVYHEAFDMDMRKKITKYHYSPMGKRLKSVGFGVVKGSLGGALGNLVSDTVKSETGTLVQDFEERLTKELENADRSFTRQADALKDEITDAIEKSKTAAEKYAAELDREIQAQVAENRKEANRLSEEQKNGLKEARRELEEAKRKLGQVGVDLSSMSRDLATVRTNAETAQRNLSSSVQNLMGSIQQQTSSLNDTKARLTTAEGELRTAKSLAESAQAGLNGKVNLADYNRNNEELLARFTTVLVGPNLVQNGGAPATVDGWSGWTVGARPTVRTGQHEAYYNGQRNLFVLESLTSGTAQASSSRFLLKRNTTYRVNYVAFTSDNISQYTIYLLGRRKGESQNYTLVKLVARGNVLPSYGVLERSFEFNSGEMDEAYLRFDNSGKRDANPSYLYFGDIDLYEGGTVRPFQPSPEDDKAQISAVQSEFRLKADGLSSKISGLEERANQAATTVSSLQQGVNSINLSVEQLGRDKVSSSAFDVELGKIRQSVKSADDKASRITQVETNLAGVSTKVGNLETRANNTLSKLTEVETKANGILTRMTSAETYISKDGQRQESLQRYSREETARQIAAERTNVSQSYVAKSQYTEDVRGVNRRFEELYQGSPNLVINGAAELGDKNWGGTNGKWFTNRTHGFYKNSSVPLFTIDTKEAGLCYIQLNRYNQLKKNTDYTLSFTGFMSGNVSGFRVYVGLLSNKDHAWKKTLEVFQQRLSPHRAERFTVSFNSGDYDGFSLRFDHLGSSDRQSATVWLTEIDVYEGTMKRAYQPSPENFENYADTKLAEYKETVEGRFATIQTVVNGKANQADFQRVRETSQLYERILGNTDNGIANNIAQMVLTNQRFQVEVGKVGSDGVNRALNTSQDWTDFITVAGSDGVNLNTDLHKVMASGLVVGDKLHVSMEISIDDVQLFTGRTATAVLQSWGDVKQWNAGNPFAYSIGNLSAGINWRKIEYDVTLTEQMLGNNFWWLNVRVDGVSRYKVHTKLLKIEKGTRATPWSPAPENSQDYVDTKLASYKQTVDGISSKVSSLERNLATTSTRLSNLDQKADTIKAAVSSLEGGALKKSEIEIRDDRILLGAGKEIKGRTLFSLFKLEPDSITALTKLMRITGDVIVDGSVTTQKLAANSVTAGKVQSGAVEAKHLAAEAVTAEKLKVDQALFDKLMANEAYLKQLFAKQAFINQVQSVTLSANRISGGVFRALNNAMEILMNNGQILYYTDQAALKRVLSGYPTQFVKFATGRVDGKGLAGVTVIGSNRWGSESSNDGGFVGIRAWNGPQVDSVDVVGDEIRLASSAYDNPDGWDVQTLDSGLKIAPHNRGAERNSRIEVGDVWILKGNGNYTSLRDVLNAFNGNFSKGPNADSYDYYPSGF